mmetsp:Transcript_77156/g.249739  ORF Transcript_77156/g.249739 Transcript_77156/m.249739 type:complete len:201 (+) Transcript_77156:147-749(+)
MVTVATGLPGGCSTLMVACGCVWRILVMFEPPLPMRPPMSSVGTTIRLKRPPAPVTSRAAAQGRAAAPPASQPVSRRLGTASAPAPVGGAPASAGAASGAERFRIASLPLPLVAVAALPPLSLLLPLLPLRPRPRLPPPRLETELPDESGPLRNLLLRRPLQLRERGPLACAARLQLRLPGSRCAAGEGLWREELGASGK